MKYIIDNDLHIHSKISTCSDDPEQTNERILKYAEDNGLKTICLTDHFWDENVEGASMWYAEQNYSHISEAKPLPQSENVRFLFGCETELKSDFTLGISKERYDCFDFIIIPTTHFQMKGYTITEEQLASPETRAKVWVERFEAVLNMDLPFHKVGIAHLTCNLIAADRETYLKTIESIPEKDMERLFKKAAALGVGIELNTVYSDSEADIVLRPYKIAKKCGCKFYLGSDAHHPAGLDKAMDRFRQVVDGLNLTEEDKFKI